MILQSLARAGSSSLRASLVRQSAAGKTLQKTPIMAFAPLQRYQAKRPATTHAISNPTLADIEKRWPTMAPQEQADLWMALRDRMKNDWHELTLQERKAAYWIAFGPHGPRALYPPGMAWGTFKDVTVVIAICCIVFVIIRAFAYPPPRTMNEQWQKMTNEYLKGQKVEPITGVSSEGYSGKGMVQSPPVKGGIPKGDDE